jgi:hypothetical protein
MTNAPTISRVVEYEFRLADNVATTAMAGAAASDKMGTAVDNTTEAVNRQNISYIKTVASLGAFRHGLRSMSMGLEDLNIISKKTNKNFYTLISAVDTFVGVALAIKGVIGLMQLLRDAEIGCAVVESYRKVLNNPATAALVLGAGLAAGAIGGYMYSQWNKPMSGQSTVGPPVIYNQTVNFQDNMERRYDTRYAARSGLEGMGF